MRMNRRKKQHIRDTLLKRLAKSAYWNTSIFSVHFWNVNAISHLKIKSAENKSASFEIYFSLYEEGWGWAWVICLFVSFVILWTHLTLHIFQLAQSSNVLIISHKSFFFFDSPFPFSTLFYFSFVFLFIYF